MMKPIMKRALFLLLCMSSIFATAEELTDTKKQAIDQLVNITGAYSIVDVMTHDISRQMIDSLYQRQWNLEPEVITLVRNEISNIMQDEFVKNGTIQNITHNIYHEHFTLDELQNILAFYRGPSGSKLLLLLPVMTEETMQASRKYGQKLVPIIQQRMKTRFEELIIDDSSS